MAYLASSDLVACGFDSHLAYGDGSDRWRVAPGCDPGVREFDSRPSHFEYTRTWYTRTTQRSGAAVACWAHNPEVTGSIPVSATIHIRVCRSMEGLRLPNPTIGVRIPADLRIKKLRRLRCPEASVTLTKDLAVDG